MTKVCKDCGSSTRKLTPPGPRCATCCRAKKSRDSKRAHEARQTKTYGLKSGEYDRLLEAQGGACAVCRKRFTYRLHTDHDHATGVVRGLLCKADNSHVLRYAKDDPERLRSAAAYLENPPAVQILGYRGLQGDPPTIWREVPDTHGWYEVSNYGDVRCWYTSNQYENCIRRCEPNLLKPFEDRYLYVNLSVNKRRRKAGVHRLVLEAFTESEPTLKACHYNGNKLDNRLSNLYWGTSRDNTDDAQRLGETPKGESHGEAKLTEENVREIRKSFAEGESRGSLVKRFPVTRSTISSILRRATWKHVE